MNAKFLVFFCWLIFMLQSSHAQLVTSFGGKSTDMARVIDTDGIGAIYVGGVFADTVDFQIDERKDLRASRGQGDIFIVRYNELEQYRNVLQIGGAGGDTIRALVFDNQNFIYVAGSFEETCDFDPRTSTLAVESQGKKDAFIAKYDSLGTPIWVKTFGNQGDDEVFDIAIDRQGNLYVAGSFQEAFFLDATDNFSRISSKGENDGFFAKYNAQGDFEWVLPIGSGNLDILPNSGMGIAIGENDNVYVAGTFVGTIDFNIRGSVFRGFSGKNTSIYVARYNADGFFLRQMARIEGESSAVSLGENGLHIDNVGNVIVTGNYSNRANFGTDTDPRFLSSRGGEDAFVAQFTPNLEYDWVVNIGGEGEDLGHGVFVDAEGGILATGQFEKSVQIGAGGNILTSKHYGAYLVKLNGNGGASYTRKLDADIAIPVGGYDITTTSGKSILWTGSFAGTPDADPSEDVAVLNHVGLSDVFLIKYDQEGNIFRPANCSSTGEKPETISDSVICSAQSVQVLVRGVGSGAGISYRFQQSSDGINFKDFGEVTPRNTITFPNLTRDIYFRAIVSCANSEQSDTTTVFPVKVANLDVNIGESPIFALPNQEIVLGEIPLAMGGVGDYTYSWTPRSFVDFATIANPTFVAQTLGVYDLQVVVSDGFCEQIRTLQVRVTVTATEDQTHQTAPYFEVKNYPNPFSERTQIEFDLPKPNRIQMQVYRTDGQKIYESEAKLYSQGKNTFTFETPNLPNGVYFYKLVGNQFTRIGKMTLIR